MTEISTEEPNLSERYGVEADHEDDLKNQIEQIAAFEAAAESGNWKLFKQIVDRNGSAFLSLMRSADGDSRLRLPLFQSGELEDSFTRSLQNLNRDWTHLMPFWARFGYHFQVALTWTGALFAAGAVGAAVRGNPGWGGILGAIALAILVVVDNAEPRVRSHKRWWVRFTYPKTRSFLPKWRTVSYVVATLMIMWFLLAPTFKLPGELCDNLSPEDRAVHEGCVGADPFLD